MEFCLKSDFAYPSSATEIKRESCFLVPPPSVLAQVQHMHQTYCRLTGQNLLLRFDRERLYLEFLRAGFTLADLVQVVRYLQREIRHTRRNVGALKLSNLLAGSTASRRTSTSAYPAHRFTTATSTHAVLHPHACSPAEQERGRQRALEQLRQLKETSANNNTPMEGDLSIVEKLPIAHRLVGQALRA